LPWPATRAEWKSRSFSFTQSISTRPIADQKSPRTPRVLSPEALFRYQIASAVKARVRVLRAAGVALVRVLRAAAAAAAVTRAGRAGRRG
jgi:hypothetical protein